MSNTNDATLRHLAYVDFSKPGSVVRGVYLQKHADKSKRYEMTKFERNGFPFSEGQLLDHLEEEGILVGRPLRGGLTGNDPSVLFALEWSRYRSLGYVHQLCLGGTLFPILFEERFEDSKGVIKTSNFQDAYPDPVTLIEPVMGYKLYWFCLETDHGRPRYIGMREPNASVWVELMDNVRMGFHTLPDSRQLAEHQVWQVREEKAWKVGAHWENYLPKEEPLPHALTYHDACLAAAQIEIERQRR